MVSKYTKQYVEQLKSLYQERLNEKVQYVSNIYSSNLDYIKHEVLIIFNVILDKVSS